MRVKAPTPERQPRDHYRTRFCGDPHSRLSDEVTIQLESSECQRMTYTGHQELNLPVIPNEHSMMIDLCSVSDTLTAHKRSRYTGNCLQ